MAKTFIIWWAVLALSLLANADDTDVANAQAFCNAPGTEKILTKGFIGKYVDFDLELENCNITRIQREAFKKVSCIALNLKNNKISYIAAGSFDVLLHMNKLVLTNNELLGENLDSSVFRNIVNLERLSLSGNNMTGAPADLLEGSNVGRIELDNCSLYEVPAFLENPNLPNLARITLAGNHLQKLSDPSVFTHVPKLWLLDLSRNNIDYIHEDLFRGNVNLTFVYLQHNKLSYLPEKLFQNIIRLNDVDLRDNLLTTLPANAFIGTTLDSLFVSYNKITSLPQNFTAQFAVGPKLYHGRVGMKFDHNPWQCACKNEFLRDVGRFKPIYVDTDVDLVEKRMPKTEDTPCVAPDDTVCHRE